MLNIENREILKKPNVQHVAARIRLKLNGQVFGFRLNCRVPLLLLSSLFARFGVTVSISVAILVSDDVLFL